MSDTRKEDGLKALGAKTEYKMDYAPEVLETFVRQRLLGTLQLPRVHIPLPYHRSARLCRDSHLLHP